MKILLFGHDGQVGTELRRSLALVGEVVAPPLAGGALCGDLCDAEGIRATLESVRPDVIVNAAGHTAVDRAEDEPDAAMRVNADGPALLARLAGRHGAWLVHYSTDYVYDGTGTRPWKEDDAAAPLSVYGASKLAGDAAVAGHARHLILRTSWVYAAHGENFARTILRLGRERSELKIIDDQVGAPTPADLLANATAHMLHAALREPALAGLYNVAPAGETSWHGYAVELLRLARARGLPVRVAESAVLPIPSSAYSVRARRPHNSRLDTTRFRRTFGLTLPDWREPLARFIETLQQ
ncbi:MAG: dTDP-4-dehydrorhamnose reductase [Burkholderiales bacterium]|nr:dTDP-4-dehydrorhamnose reductase [Burkholderiales bacterium]